MNNKLNFSQHKYSNSNKLTKEFKQSYLTSLQLILDDEKFKEKAENLPLLKSSVINKYEKLLAKAKLKIISKKKNKLKNAEKIIMIFPITKSTRKIILKNILKK